MEENSKNTYLTDELLTNRRTILKTAAASAIIGGLGVTPSAAFDEESDIETLEATLNSPDWNKEITVEPPSNQVGTVVGSNLGYFGSQLQEQWVGNEKKERWAHFFEISCVAKTNDSDAYSIYSQEFECEQDSDSNSDIEVHSDPHAGAIAWPQPSSGNWDEVVKTLVEEAVSEVSSVVSGVRTASEIIDAYKESDFDTEQDDLIEMQDTYMTWVRDEASHSVNFMIHTIPGKVASINIRSSTSAHVGQARGGEYKVYMENDSVPYPFAQDTDIRSKLDEMDDEELEEAGIIRVKPEIVTTEIAENSRFELSQKKPSYIAKYPISVEQKPIKEEEEKIKQPVE